MAGRKRNNFAFRTTCILLIILSLVTLFVNYFNIPSDLSTRPAFAAVNRQAFTDLKLKIDNELRRHRVNRVCSYIYAIPKKLDWVQFLHERELPDRDLKWWEHLHVNEKNKILYCSIPKVASTNLLVYLLKLDSPAIINDSSSAEHLRVHWRNFSSQHVKNLAEFPLADARRILETYRKMIWVRNPLDRIISAWKSKLATTHHSYYSGVVGSQIIRLFRQNATSDEIRHGFPVELHEFFRLLATQHHPQFFDVHWRPFVDMCSVCAIDYDYIGKLEDIDEELDVFIRNATESKRFAPKLRQPTKKYEHSEKQADLMQSFEKGLLSRNLLKKVLLLYKIDYDLFGYNMAEDGVL